MMSLTAPSTGESVAIAMLAITTREIVRQINHRLDKFTVTGRAHFIEQERHDNGNRKIKISFIAPIITVFCITCQKTGDDISVAKYSIPTQIFGGIIRYCSNAILVSQMGK